MKLADISFESEIFNVYDPYITSEDENSYCSQQDDSDSIYNSQLSDNSYASQSYYSNDTYKQNQRNRFSDSRSNLSESWSNSRDSAGLKGSLPDSDSLERGPSSHLHVTHQMKPHPLMQ